jgi:hypothetical protein
VITRHPQSSDHPETPSHGLATVARRPRCRFGFRLRDGTSTLRGRHRSDREVGHSTTVSAARCTTLSPLRRYLGLHSLGDVNATQPLRHRPPRMLRGHRRCRRRARPAGASCATLAETASDLARFLQGPCGSASTAVLRVRVHPEFMLEEPPAGGSDHFDGEEIPLPGKDHPSFDTQPETTPR